MYADDPYGQSDERAGERSHRPPGATAAAGGGPRPATSSSGTQLGEDDVLEEVSGKQVAAGKRVDRCHEHEHQQEQTRAERVGPPGAGGSAPLAEK